MNRPIGSLRTWALLLGLLVLSVPWYWAGSDGQPIVFGFPLWCLVSAMFTLGLSIVTTWMIGHHWKNDSEEE